jgi:hypothetical protein
MGAVGDFLYNAYEAGSDWGNNLIGRTEATFKYQEEKKKKEDAYERLLKEQKNAPILAAAEARRKAALRSKRIADAGRASTFHSISPSPLGSAAGLETFGG